MTDRFDIPDKRSNNPKDYQKSVRLGQMKRSWHLGVQRQRDERATISFADGLTWGSIGQILGYLFGETDDAFKNELYEKMLAQFTQTDHGQQLAPRREVRIASWNLRYSAVAHTRRRIAYLQTLDWDVLSLQEVSRKAWEELKQSGLMESGCYTLEEFGLTPGGYRPHGAAILARHGLTLHDPRLVPDLPKPERALSVQVAGLAIPLEVISWHAPNAAGEGPETKIQAYRAVTSWLTGKETATVLCFDGNSWNASVQLNREAPTDTAHPYYEEGLFFSSSAPHPLEDTLLTYYRNNPEAHQAIVQLRPDGPLAISYVRGSRKKPVPDRFDYIFASPDIEVFQCTYDYEGGIGAGSDHGIVTADLTVGQPVK
ncbi:MAG: endonuclease/exonuclease/phosphatase family protein [Candidatus Promineifilaceae bacterium]